MSATKVTHPKVTAPSAATHSDGSNNQLVQMLPRKERKQLMAICEPVTLVLAEVLCEHGEHARHVYFPVDAFVSLVALIDGHPGLEMGMVGREGMVGAHLALGVDTAPMQGIVQGSGSAWRAPAVAFRALLLDCPALQKLLLRYNHVLMTQQVTAAACMRFHQIEPRLARWLLMSQDRAHANHFYMTHEFLALMLGVRRVGITTAASAMHRAGLIEYSRGNIEVLNRTGLEENACTCYGDDVRAYQSVLC